MTRNCKDCQSPDCMWVGANDSKTCNEYVPQTNGDRIRKMTDEELAEWFAGHDAGLVANVLNNDYVEPTKGGWLDWLKQEAME